MTRPSTTRTEYLSFRLSPSEHQAVKDAAKKAAGQKKVKVSEWARRVVLEAAHSLVQPSDPQ